MYLQAILAPFKEVVLTIGPLLLNLLYALILLLIGLLIARGLHWVVVTLFIAAQLDKGCKKIGFSDLLTEGGLKIGPTELLADLFYWLTVFVTVTVAANVLGLISAKILLAGLLAFLPLVLSAAYVLGVGIFLAVFISGVILLIANNIGLSNAVTLAKIVQYAILIFAALIALGHLGISGDWFTNSIIVIVAAIGLAFAIAFGLGAKERATDFLDGLFE